MPDPDLEDRIDQAVERWHAGHAGYGQSLREYLGMTEAEYQIWALSGEPPEGYKPPSAPRPRARKR